MCNQRLLRVDVGVSKEVFEGGGRELEVGTDAVTRPHRAQIFVLQHQKRPWILQRSPYYCIALPALSRSPPTHQHDIAKIHHGRVWLGLLVGLWFMKIIKLVVGPSKGEPERRILVFAECIMHMNSESYPSERAPST